jgi:prefoldin subunit 5
MTYCTSPWVCDDCKEAIAFLKDFKKEYAKAREMLNKNVK